MRFIGVLLTFAGYLLIYAAVARGGRFATEPWAGLYADAYLSTDAAVAAPTTLVPVSPVGPANVPSPGAGSEGTAAAGEATTTAPRTIPTAIANAVKNVFKNLL